MIKKMVKEYIIGSMEIDVKKNTRVIRKMVKKYFTKPVEKSTKKNRNKAS